MASDKNAELVHKYNIAERFAHTMVFGQSIANAEVTYTGTEAGFKRIGGTIPGMKAYSEALSKIGSGMNISEAVSCVADFVSAGLDTFFEVLWSVLIAGKIAGRAYAYDAGSKPKTADIIKKYSLEIQSDAIITPNMTRFELVGLVGWTYVRHGAVARLTARQCLLPSHYIASVYGDSFDIFNRETRFSNFRAPVKINNYLIQGDNMPKLLNSGKRIQIEGVREDDIMVYLSRGYPPALENSRGVLSKIYASVSDKKAFSDVPSFKIELDVAGPKNVFTNMTTDDEAALEIMRVRMRGVKKTDDDNNSTSIPPNADATSQSESTAF